MREFTFTACECGALFPRRYDRIPTCPRCGADVELPGVDACSDQPVFDCAPVRPYSPEVM